MNGRAVQKRTGMRTDHSTHCIRSLKRCKCARATQQCRQACATRISYANDERYYNETTQISLSEEAGVLYGSTITSGESTMSLLSDTNFGLH